MLKINNIYYNKNELIQLATIKLESAITPQWEKDIYLFIHEWLNEKDHIIVKTSGSTGEPKVINLKKEWLEYSAKQTCNFFKITIESNALLCLPAAYIAGKMMIVRALVSGMNLIVVEPSGNPLSNQSIIHSIDFAALTPFQLAESFESLKENPVVKTIIVGGGEISPWLEQKTQALPVDIYATYGMTETSSHIALRKVNGSNKQDSFSVIGDSKIDVDARGCLTIENSNLFEGVLITNDLVDIIDYDKFKWIGRIDNIINSGAIKIIPEEIESLIAHLRPEPMFISSIPDSKLGEALVLVIESIEFKEEQKMVLFDQMSRIIQHFKLPKKIVVVKSIPRTPNEKVDRKALKSILLKNL